MRMIQNLNEIKNILHQRKQELEDELGQTYEQKFSDEQIQDLGDQTFISTMESLRSSFQDARLEEYKRIVRALEMIDEGTYGICVDCSKHISEKRLQSFPN